MANGRGYVPRQVLVKFEDHTPQNMMYEQVRRNGARVVDEVRALDVLGLGVPQAQKQRIVAALSRNPNVEYAEPIYGGSAAFAPDDPHFGPYQWGLKKTGQNIKSGRPTPTCACLIFAVVQPPSRLSRLTATALSTHVPHHAAISLSSRKSSLSVPEVGSSKSRGTIVELSQKLKGSQRPCRRSSMR